MNLTSKDLLILSESAKLYMENLANKNLLIIYQNRDTKKYLYLQLIFLESNFLHLTGVDFNRFTRNNTKSKLFLESCLNNKLSLNDLTYRSDGTTRIKLDILKDIVSMHTKATMVGNYNNSRTTLFTEKICGNIRVCMGTTLTDNNYYVPNTALKEDIRKIVTEWHPIKAIYFKNVKDKKYHSNNLTRISKDFKSSLAETLYPDLIEID